ncbi:hypothetical protein W02_16600 [Nitrospira sp. KM1]|nr:hypothetical protein W02_16600 [Nitrospira sp. KM1]
MHDMESTLSEKLKDFDRDMEQLLKDWNAPGVGVDCDGIIGCRDGALTCKEVIQSAHVGKYQISAVVFQTFLMVGITMRSA